MRREAKTMTIDTTMLDLVSCISEVTRDDREVVATVVALVNSGRVRLTGSFRGARIALDEGDWA
jgi:hypothetical protein